MDFLAGTRKTPAAAKVIGKAAGLLLAAIEGDDRAEQGIAPSYETSLARFADDPEGTLNLLESCNPDALSNGTVHALMHFLNTEVEYLTEEALLDLANSEDKAWGAALANYGLATRSAVAKVMVAPGRMPMQPQTF
eukprot:CAMPEP_0119525350 /NCGR_PEP_ID=MMETSP1344-20130328/40154_1 /TAXON_ID=236787 /ORGANISM="Florenciella parvula, Strain CCMP2471" /LENGTH=135 /DNA_ID=CAMNT_0007564103 /DNA_START=238 /DNA_END=642 /DNA_ORIENTATION=+